MKEIARKISVYVQRDSIAIPTSSYIQSVRHCWFVVSFTYVCTTNAKPFKPLSEGVVMKETARIIIIAASLARPCHLPA